MYFSPCCRRGRRLSARGNKSRFNESTPLFVQFNHLTFPPGTDRRCPSPPLTIVGKNMNAQKIVMPLTVEYSANANAWALSAEPWPEPVDGRALLDELAQLLRRFVVLPPTADTTLALWIVHTYAFHLRDVSTYVGVESPEKRCGKTTLLSVLNELVNRPVVASNISSPAFFRVIEETRPTLLIDEADTLLQGNDELRGILNSGYSRKAAFVVRVANQFTNDDLRFTHESRKRESVENQQRVQAPLAPWGRGTG
jgi:hypothetical protein